MSDNYAAIILDIQHSRTYDDEKRFYVQDKLFSIIQFINEYYSKELVKLFEFSSGDSIQALFKDVSADFSCYCFIKNLFYPYQLRCGIGYGKLNQRILDKDYYSTNMFDGEAYHYAISALNDCKKEGYGFLIYSCNEEKDYFVNQIMSTVELLNFDLTIKQADVFDLFNLLYPLEIKYEGHNLDRMAKFIFYKLKQNVLSYRFDKEASNFIKDVLFDEGRYDYFRKEKFHKLFDPQFSTKMNSVCSVLLNVSRHNIEKIRDVGKFDEIRKLECLVFEYMKKEYRG